MARRILPGASRAAIATALLLSNEIVSTELGLYRGDGMTLGGKRLRDADDPILANTVTTKAPGTGAITETTEDVLNRRLDVMRYGAKGNWTAIDLAAFVAAAKAARIGYSDGSRTFAGEIHLPPGRYLINNVLDLCQGGPVAGMTFTGSGAGCTEIVYTASAATIKAPGARDITFRDLTFRSLDATIDTALVSGGGAYGVGQMQSAFTISHSFGTDSAALRSWKFERCIFAGFYKVFNVTGTSMCSEFFFDKCGFGQNYIGMDNSNDQAVNWNFVNCNWENEGLDLTGTSLLRKNAAIFKLQKGTSVKWTGGSLIWFGKLVQFNLTSAFSFAGTSHGLVFDGIRAEMCDDNGTIQPLWDRPEDGSYVGPGNNPKIALLNSELLVRGNLKPIVNTLTLFKVWDNVKFVVDNCELAGGKVKGVYSGLTASNTGMFTLTRSTSLTYEEDTTNQTGAHVGHVIDIFPDAGGGGSVKNFQQRNADLSAPYSTGIKSLAVRGNTGSLPQGGTTVALGTFTKHTQLLQLVIRRFYTTAAGSGLTVQLRDAADTTTYGEAILAGAGDKTARGDINREIGYDIPVGTALMLKFIGTAEIIKGVVYVEYM